MIVSLKWLRNYVDVYTSVEELADRLTMVGLEVEGISQRYPLSDDVVTARVETVEMHPRADRLHVCSVAVGGSTYRVVCGAPNVEVGMVAPLALPGARLADGTTLREAVIRGQVSHGMLCSRKELGLDEDASGIWELPPETPVGVPVREALGLDDVIVDVSITPNRGDCLSILGIAREVSAVCKSPLRYPSVAVKESGPAIESMSSVTVNDPIGCPRYSARIVQGVTVGPSPAWLREKVEAVGIRSINNIVDVTNFILMELGQPLHAFDFDRLREHRIVVRRASEGEKFRTLDGVDRTLFADTLLICDGVGPVAVAGIMGGENSEIRQETKRVLIESAYFDPLCIRRTGKKLGLRSEASYRFERGVDPNGVIRALDRAAQLMLEVGGGEAATGRIDVYPTPYRAPELVLRVARTNRFLGTNLDVSEMVDALRRIEMKVDVLDDDRLQVTPPSFRPDITREVDLTEEIARLVGYDRVPVSSPVAKVESAPLDPHLAARQEVKELLKGAGFFEVLTYSFISLESLQKLRFAPEDPRLRPIRLMNPLSEEQAVMRTSLVPGLLQTAVHNFGRLNEDLRIYELSKVFLPSDGQVLPAETHCLAGLAAGKRAPHLLYGSEDETDYTDVKGAVEAVLELFNLERLRYAAEDLPPYFDAGCAASVFCRDRRLGSLGRLHPAVEEAFDFKKPIYLFELDFDEVYAVKYPFPMFRPLPRFPAVARDMALVVDENLQVQDPLDFILRQEEGLLEKIELFDIYRNPQFGPGRKSIGYRLVYRAADRSLTDEEVNVVHNGLVAKVLDIFHAVLR